MYTDEEKSTAVSYRIVNQNLPKFIDNMRVFEIIMSTELCMDIARFEKEISELLNGRKIEDFFRLENYAGTVTHTAIEFYNLLIGGRTLENGSQIKGINQYVNDFNQKNSKNKEVRKIPKLKVLYKQILADRETLSFVDEQFEDDQTVIDTINSVVKDIYDKVIRNDAENSFAKLFGNIANYDLDKIYIANGQAMTNLSNAVLGDWALIKRCIEQEYDELNAKKAKNEKYFDTRSATLKKQGSYSIGRLNELVHKYSDKKECLESYYVSLGKRAVAQGEEENLLDTFEKAYTKAEELLNSDYSSKHGLASDKKNVAVLKQLLDSVKAIEEFVKPLFGTKTEKEKDDAFYGELDLVYKTLEQIVPLYNKVRNYVTRKPYSTEKVKLNFQNPTLLKGWAKGNEITNAGLIFRKGNNFYLGIIVKGNGNDFKYYPEPEDGNDIIEKVEYLQAAVFAGENIQLEMLKNKYLPEEINDIRKKKSYSTQSELFMKTDLSKFIDFYKDRVREYFSEFEFKFKETDEYPNFGAFTDDINRQAY